MTAPNAGRPHQVAIVVDPEFGERLVALAERLHVWIAHTTSNRPAAEQIWKAGETHTLERGVTTFQVDESQSVDEWLLDILHVVIEHHGEYSHFPPVSRIEIHGCDPTAIVVAELAACGFAEIGAGLNHWTASLPPGAVR